jgi:hypothetical protein
MSIQKDKIEEGNTYIFEVKVTTSDGKLKSTASVKRTFDYVPHGGTCEIDKADGKI